MFGSEGPKSVEERLGEAGRDEGDLGEVGRAEPKGFMEGCPEEQAHAFYIKI